MNFKTFLNEDLYTEPELLTEKVTATMMSDFNKSKLNEIFNSIVRLGYFDPQDGSTVFTKIPEHFVNKIKDSKRPRRTLNTIGSFEGFLCARFNGDIIYFSLEDDGTVIEHAYVGYWSTWNKKFKEFLERYRDEITTIYGITTSTDARIKLVNLIKQRSDNKYQKEGETLANRLQNYKINKITTNIKKSAIRDLQTVIDALKNHNTEVSKLPLRSVVNTIYFRGFAKTSDIRTNHYGVVTYRGDPIGDAYSDNDIYRLFGDDMDESINEAITPKIHTLMRSMRMYNTISKYNIDIEESDYDYIDDNLITKYNKMGNNKIKERSQLMLDILEDYDLLIIISDAVTVVDQSDLQQIAQAIEVSSRYGIPSWIKNPIYEVIGVHAVLKDIKRNARAEKKEQMRYFYFDEMANLLTKAIKSIEAQDFNNAKSIINKIERYSREHGIFA